MSNNLIDSNGQLDVLVVGAGPTGLTLAAQLDRFGVRFRIIDKQLERAHESRALAVQARSLEILQTVGIGEELARRGRTTTRVMLHIDRGEPSTFELGNIGRTDTRFPFILFVSQPETEGTLIAHLTSRGIAIERGVELATMQQRSNGVACVLRHTDRREESVLARYVAGCDGAHSAVRKQSGIRFEGGDYAQEFALGDVEADGLQHDSIHAFGAGRGFAIFFPLGHPTTWRVMAMEPLRQQHNSDDRQEITIYALSLAELQAMISGPTYGSVNVRDAVWLTRFRLHHRQAAQYRAGRVFLAGDAAHIHSPVGAQGMNTGIQDAWNLGWKLGMVSKSRASERLLDSYEAERWPVGRTLLRATDRAFGVFTKSVSGAAPMMLLRRALVRTVVAPALSHRGIRTFAFGFVSQLDIRYRRSPAVMEGEPRLRRGPHAGDRVPDARLRRGRQPTWLQQELAAPFMHLLLCGPVAAWNGDEIVQLRRRFPDLLAVTHLSREASQDALLDDDGSTLSRLGVENTAQYLLRPDGHVAFRCGGADLRSAAAYLRAWFTGVSEDSVPAVDDHSLHESESASANDNTSIRDGTT